MDYFSEKIEEAQKRIPTMEHMLGKGLLQPFANTNSGSRKLMYSVHRDQSLPLMRGEKAIVETGYEIRFGDLSSSVVSTDSDYRVVKKIPKFSFSPNHHYYLIVEDIRAKRLDVIERISYHPISECYGYLNNNQLIDTIQEGDMIPKDTIIQKSMAFDEYNNRKDGVNLNVLYMSLDLNQEDSVIMSQSAADKLKAPLIKVVPCMINENNIPVNLYGDNNLFKCHPDIGEDIKDGILIALRKEKKEEIPFTESVENLRRKFMSDEKKLLKGKVIDINIYVNNPDNLNQFHNQQFKMYYDELQRMSHDIVSTVSRFKMEGYELSHELDTLYGTSKAVMNHEQYIEKKPFSNIYMEFIVLEEVEMMPGDKGTNRYGGKGVTSRVMPDELMPEFGPDHEKVDVILNLFTMYNRKNPGQTFEQHINHVGHEIVKYIANCNCSIDQGFEMILKFLHVVSPQQEDYMRSILSQMDEEDRMFFMDSFVECGNIQISTRPISDSFDIDRLLELYNTFPFVDEYDLYVVMNDSNGNPRRVKARRKAIVGKEYYFRLKQIAEEKFSATSLSAVNIRGENTKSKANKNWLIMYPNTPIRFGNMEINDLAHLGIEYVVEALMIHSVSPEARKRVERLYTDNPYHVNIDLDKESRNIVAEVVQTMLKSIGKRIRFVKIPKRRIVPLDIHPLEFSRPPIMNPLLFASKDDIADPDFDVEKYFEENNKHEQADESTCPVVWSGADHEISTRRMKNEIVAYQDRKLTLREVYEKYKGAEEL